MKCAFSIMVSKNPIGSRRSDAWWEPTYDPTLHGKLAQCKWDFSSSTGPKNGFLRANDLKEISTDGSVIKFEGLKFEKCDIQGTFEHRPSIVFRNCTFVKCDFAFSEWYRTNFIHCKFIECSFALSSFEECEFRDCKWVNIGMQGSKTDFIRTFITNPKDFIDAGFSGLKDESRTIIKHRLQQKSRLEKTKAQVSRTILQSHRDVGDDDTFYESAKVHDLQQVKAAIYENIYQTFYKRGCINKLNITKVPVLICECALLISSGFCNNWGSSIFKPLFLLLLCFVVFGFAYPVTRGDFDFSFAAERSFNISILAGYGNAVQIGDSKATRLASYLHVTLAALFYTVFFSTMISRNSRSR